MTSLEQALRIQGYRDEDISKITTVMNHPEAYKHALETKDFNAAFEMTIPKKSTTETLSELIESFAKERPSDAESLSIALTEFSEFVQKSLDNKKAP